MDSVAQPPKTSVNSETEAGLLYAVNDILQKMVCKVDNKLQNTKSTYVASAEMPFIDVNERPKRDDNRQHEVMNNTRCRTVQSTAQPDLTATGQINYQTYSQNVFKSSECKNYSTLVFPAACVKEKKVSHRNYKEDLIGSAENVTSPKNQESVFNDREEQKYMHDQDLEILKEDFENAFENNECTDAIRKECLVKDLPPDYKRDPADGVLNSEKNSTDATTYRQFEDIEISTDSSDTDEMDEESIIADSFEEIGDQEEMGDLDDTEFFDRIVEYVRETDMLLMANRGSGDYVNIFTDNDSDEEYMIE